MDHIMEATILFVAVAVLILLAVTWAPAPPRLT
jgi:hypothetical protein